MKRSLNKIDLKIINLLNINGNLEKETKNVISLVEQLIGPDLKFKNFIAILYCKYSLQFSREDLNEISRNLYEDIEEYLEKFENYVEPEYIKKYLKE